MDMHRTEREKVWFQTRCKPTEISSTPWQRGRNRDAEILSNNNYVWNATERETGCKGSGGHVNVRKEKTHPKTFRIHLSNYAIHQDKTVSNHGLRKDYGTREERYRKPFFDFINSPHPTRCFHLPPNEISISKLNSDCELYSAALFMS